MSRRADIKDAFRQIPVDPLHAAKHGDVFGEYVVVDLFRKFEGRCSPGFSDLVATHLDYARNQTGFQQTVVSEHGRLAAM